MEKTTFQTYVGVKRIQAEPQEKDGKPGYHVVYEDGYESWSPKDVFERAYLAIARPDKLTDADIANFMSCGEMLSENRGEKTTLVEFIMPTGWIDYEVSSCVSPINYDQELGEKICIDHIANRLWSHLGFVLSPYAYTDSRTDAAYISAASPDVGLALIEKIENYRET